MQIEPLTRIDQIKEGDGLIISNGSEITMATAKRVKVTEYDGTEVIFKIKQNKYFNVGMYLEGKSWAKDIRVVTMNSETRADVLDDRTKKAIHILRNPFGWDTEDRRRAAHDACNAIERYSNAYENMRQFAEDNGLDTTCYQPSFDR